MRTALVAVALSGCSFGGALSEPKRPQSARAQCRADTARDVSMTLFSLGVLGLGIWGEVEGGPLDMGPDLIISGALGAMAFTTSAIYGAVHGSTCTVVESPAEQVADQRARARQQAQAAAWTATKQAAASARAGDCAMVTRLDADVRTLDADFHATVFLRDVAIARCLSHDAGL